jgi:hypothetical protein
VSGALSWLSKASEAQAPAAARGQRSLSLRALVDGLRPASRPAVLDLGPPLAGNLKFFSALQCRLRVVDLHRSLAAEPLDSRSPGAMGALVERLLPLQPDERFDALLAWDVFDYMRPDQVAALMAPLVPRLRPSAHVLVLVSTRPQIPATPARFRIVDRETLQDERASGEEALAPRRPCPRHTQSALAHMMPGLSVRRCYLLRNGIQEYLLAPGH